MKIISVLGQKINQSKQIFTKYESFNHTFIFTDQSILSPELLKITKKYNISPCFAEIQEVNYNWVAIRYNHIDNFDESEKEGKAKNELKRKIRELNYYSPKIIN